MSGARLTPPDEDPMTQLGDSLMLCVLMALGGVAVHTGDGGLFIYAAVWFVLMLGVGSERAKRRRATEPRGACRPEPPSSRPTVAGVPVPPPSDARGA